MKRQSEQFEWQILSTPEEWPDGADMASVRESKQRVAGAMVRVPSRTTPSNLLWLATLLLVTTLCYGLYLWREARRGVELIEAELAEAVTVEQWSQMTDRSTGAMIDPFTAAQQSGLDGSDRITVGLEPEPLADVEIVDLILKDEVAAVQAIMTTAAGERYRQTRFYRQTANGWVRTEPQPQLWGPSRTLRTDHLLFRYQQRDERAVQEAAPAIESFYVALASVLDLPVSVEPPVIVISVQRPPDGIGRTLPPLTVASPATALASVQTSESALLKRSAILTLSEHIRISVARHSGLKPHERSLVDALLLWQLNEADILPVHWHTAAVLALYRLLTGSHAKIETQDTYHDLCTMAKRWGSTPLRVYASVLCRNAGNEPGSFSWPPEQQPRTTLAEFHVFSLEWNRFYQELESEMSVIDPDGDFRLDFAGTNETLALVTIIEYLATQYGNDSLCGMYAPSARNMDWDTMLQDVFHVSASEFEPAWQQHLAETYGIDVP